MSSGIRELRVWQEAVSLAGEVIRVVRAGMRRETTTVSESVMRTALSVGTHIADGFARPTVADQRESYLAAKRALLCLETELAIARQADLVPAGAFTELSARAGQVIRLLTGYLVYLDRQLADTHRTPVVSDARGDAPAAAPSSKAVDAGRART